VGIIGFAIPIPYASLRRELVDGCPNEPKIKALSWEDVEEIVGRFESLNCYDRTKVPGFDPED
jgi:hypothetical protein